MWAKKTAVGDFQTTLDAILPVGQLFTHGRQFQDYLKRMYYYQLKHTRPKPTRKAIESQTSPHFLLIFRQNHRSKREKTAVFGENRPFAHLPASLL